ncbi:hypothetical protein AB0B45_40050 [Nonomuraea sp. NPDC049152]|uniref:hypothetical protein n=1 Tax=Nonomuraea sp. NPDC049152 TaxID=3154350 RepID=UPI0033E86B39
MTPEQYAQAVRETLAGHPNSEELLEDLDDHLAEVASESEVPLEVRLGPPEAYAAELAAAYGGRTGERRRRFDLRATGASLAGHPAVARLTGLFPELRPGWWVLRGYVLAMLLISVADRPQLVPDALGEFALVAFAIWLSYTLGRARRGRWVTIASALASGIGVLALLAGFAAAEERSFEPAIAYQEPVMMNPVSTLGDVINIRPYSKDGTPLSDVYLYDQDGRPVTTSFEDSGYVVDRGCGEPVLNRYPLPLVQYEETVDDTGTAFAPTKAPSACAAPSASPGPLPSATAAPLPSATRSPSPTKRSE